MHLRHGETAMEDSTRVMFCGGSMVVRTSGRGSAFMKGTSSVPGGSAALTLLNASNAGEGIWAGHSGTSSATVMKLVLPSSSTNNFLECHRPDATRKCHITSNGTFVAGSDFAEALPAHGSKDQYEPGDVIVLAENGTEVETTRERYSRRVVGVYSTRPGVLGAEKGGGVTRVDVNDIPVAIVGIVPTKVSAENGAVAPGDLLVSASLADYAMKATDQNLSWGAVIGKAMEPMVDGHCGSEGGNRSGQRRR